MNFITRTNAANILFKLSNSDVLDKNIASQLEDIAFCILLEQKKIHAWNEDKEKIYALDCEPERMREYEGKVMFLPSLNEAG